jgi:hypothetical protein
VIEVAKIFDILLLPVRETSQQLFAQAIISALAKEDYSFIIEIFEVPAGEEVKLLAWWGNCGIVSDAQLKNPNFCLTFNGISVNFISNVGKSGEFGKPLFLLKIL